MRGYRKEFFSKENRGRDRAGRSFPTENGDAYQHDMAYEADRIIRESVLESMTRGNRRRPIRGFLLPFLFGVFFTVILALVAFFIFVYPAIGILN